MTNKELQAYLTRFPEEAEVVWPVLSVKDRTVYSKLNEEHVKLRRMVKESSGTWFTYSDKGHVIVLSLGD